MNKLALFVVVLLMANSAIAQQSLNCQVRKITVFTDPLKRGGNPAYDTNGDTIAYQKLYLNGNYEIAVSDTGIKTIHCITCDTSLLPAEIKKNKHKGNVQFTPDGKYILFTSENQYGFHLLSNNPGAGVNHDIFLMTRDGSKFWKLTNNLQGYGILHPAISHSGKKLFWGEMYQSFLFPKKGQEYGYWRLKMADFRFDASGNPYLTNIKTFMPLDTVWYESHSFSADDRYITFTSHHQDSAAYYGDIMVMDTADIGTKNFVNLTSSTYTHDEHSHFSPDGKKISWMSGPYTKPPPFYISELHLMDSDGGNKVQLTHFSTPGYPEYVQDTVVTADHYWSPDGTHIFGFVNFITPSKLWQAELYVLQFMGPCGLDTVTTGIPNLPVSDGKFNIYPNPAMDKVVIQSDADGEVYWQSLLGNIAFQTRVTKGNNAIDISALPKGFYIARLQSGTQVQVKKVLIQ